ncbi:MAG: hypothetical protein PHP44_09440 [Kiritimatiellae bacterium]|nr:hypothetical protein [Kiritimatiellia bacterium]
MNKATNNIVNNIPPNETKKLRLTGYSWRAAGLCRLRRGSSSFAEAMDRKHAPSKRGRILDEKWHKKRRKCQKTGQKRPKIEKNVKKSVKNLKTDKKGLSWERRSDDRRSRASHRPQSPSSVRSVSSSVAGGRKRS